ncbi:AAA family ATPase [Solobacterium moorei]|uniref:AAA family ATPase n=1 Tax=Solobacterium moorei TaxID=102148 RepID=UPI0004068B9C|nr:AAA family ATPase [Solobacterium moorei]BET21217.1 AAA family ATPase [Solobacterium moorei]
MNEQDTLFMDASMHANEQQESIKINSLELENVKRVKAVKLEPTKNGLTVVGGKNNQGKTSVLDAIAWALGGAKYKPSQAQREGSLVEPQLHIELSNGMVVERLGKNGTLKVTDPSGQKGNQSLLDSFISQFALDLPKFMEADKNTKAKILLQIIGVGDKLSTLDKQESELYNRRTEIGRIADQKKKYADEMVQWDGVPEDIVSAAELIQQQQEILARNGRNQELRNQAKSLEAQKTLLEQRIEEAQKTLNTMHEQMAELQDKLVIANTNAKDLQDESTAELEESIANIDSTNAKVRDNLNKQRAQEEADEYKRQYGDLTTKIEDIRKSRMELLNGVEMPLQDLSVQDGELIYKGQKWDNMSGSDQLKVATAIVRKTNPKCGFVLLDKLEQMDIDTMNEFGKWLQDNNLQAIATRVSTGDECSIFIEDGYSVDKEGNKTADTFEKPAEANKKEWF